MTGFTFRCQIKMKTSNIFWQLQCTLSMEASQKIFHCPSCDQKCTTKKGIQIHILRKHTEPNIKCTKCDFKTALINKMTLHFQSIHENVTYKCKFCDHTMKSRNSLRVHTKIKHLNTEPIFCSMCDYKTTIKYHMKQHRKAMHELGEFHCKLCDYVARCIINLNHHTKSKHTEANMFCNLCDYKTSIKRNLTNHIENIHGTKSLNCDSCPFTTKSSSYYRDHIKCHIDGNQCKSCNYVAITKSNLNKHIQEKHTEAKTSQKRSMNKHLKTKPGIKCQFCEFSSISKKGLRVHIKTEHDHMTKGESKHLDSRDKYDILHLEKNNQDTEKENIFGCQYCSMSRLTWTQLMEHIKIMHQSLTDTNILETLTKQM